MPFYCPGSHETRILYIEQTCSCGNVHDHYQAQCDTCGWVKTYHEAEKMEGATDHGTYEAENVEPQPS